MIGEWLATSPAGSPIHHRAILIHPGQNSGLPTTHRVPSHAPWYPALVKHIWFGEAVRGGSNSSSVLPIWGFWAGCITLGHGFLLCKLGLCTHVAIDPATGRQTASLRPAFCG